MDGPRSLVAGCSLLLGSGLLLEGSRGAALGAAGVLSLGVVAVLSMPRPLSSRPAVASAGRVAALEARVDGLREALAAVSARHVVQPGLVPQVGSLGEPVPTSLAQPDAVTSEPVLSGDPVAPAFTAPSGRHARIDQASSLVAALDHGWDLPQLRLRDPLPPTVPFGPITVAPAIGNALDVEAATEGEQEETLRVITLPLVWTDAALAPVVAIRRGA